MGARRRRGDARVRSVLPVAMVAAAVLLPWVAFNLARFASQWLRLQDLDDVSPDPILYPYYDRTLAQALQKETELFVASLVRENRSVLELLTADYTYVNERVARHYGIGGVTGTQFRRVALPAEQGVIALPQTAVSSTLYGDSVFVVKPGAGCRSARSCRRPRRGCPRRTACARPCRPTACCRSRPR